MRCLTPACDSNSFPDYVNLATLYAKTCNSVNYVYLAALLICTGTHDHSASNQEAAANIDYQQCDGCGSLDMCMVCCQKQHAQTVSLPENL